MEKHSVPGIPKYRAFRTREGVEEYITKDLEGEYVVKADGLCGGKGVKASSAECRILATGMRTAMCLCPA